MNREAAKQEVRNSWTRLYPADRKGKGIICPLCSSGSGSHGTGITENPKKPNQLKCWNCGFQGDVIDLIQQETGADYNTALKKAAAELGIEIDPYRQSAAADFADDGDDRPAQNAQNAPKTDFKESDDKKTGQQDKTPQRGAEEAAAANVTDYTEYYKECNARLSDPAALSYLQARGISELVADAYYLGYDPEWISPTVRKSQAAKGSEWTPAPTARIIMPISKNHYIARAISPDVQKEFAKMNETGGGKTAIFNRRALYGDREAVFLVEGVFDALSIIEAGAAAVALNSTSNADKLIKQLEQEPTRATIILCLDNDEPGKKAAAVIKDGLTRLNISYVTADITGRYKDPNDALKGDRAAFEAAIQTAEAQTAAKPDNVSNYIDNLMQGEIARLKAAADRKTGFEVLDRKSGGLYPGLYVIAATSSLGKTTFSLQIADNLAAAGHDVLFFSMEQSRLELVSKSLARITAQQDKETAVSSLTIRKGYAPEALRAAAAQYKETIADRLSIIEGNFNCNISFIGDYIRRYIRRNQCSPIVFIDYLQILQPAEENRRMTVKETVDNTVTELKRISREHDLTVFIISSVNRANYLTPIDFESLKESGGIEYTADVIWGLQLQCLNDPLFDDPQKKIKEKRQKIRQEKARDPRQIELLCLKNRYGIANFSCGFDYYPAHDLFVQSKPGEFNPYYGENPFNDTKPAEGNGQPITASF